MLLTGLLIDYTVKERMSEIEDISIETSKITKTENKD